MTDIMPLVVRGLYQPKLNAAHKLLQDMNFEIQRLDQEVTGFNVGVTLDRMQGRQSFTHTFT